MLLVFDEDETMVNETLRNLGKLKEMVKIVQIDMKSIPINEFLPGYSFHLIVERLMFPGHKNWRGSLEKLLSKLKKEGLFCYFELGGDAWNVRGEFTDLLAQPQKEFLHKCWEYYFQERTKIAPSDAESIASLLIR